MWCQLWVILMKWKLPLKRISHNRPKWIMYIEASPALIGKQGIVASCVSGVITEDSVASEHTRSLSNLQLWVA